MPDLRGIEEDVRFAWGAADSLVAELRHSADACTSDAAHRNSSAQQALTQWRGVYAEQFRDRMRICGNDAGRLATSMRNAATNLAELKRLAREEQRRREQARAWKHDQDNQNIFENAWEGLFGDNDTPPPPPAADPPHFVSEPPVSGGAQRSAPAHLSGTSTVSSARPDDLDAFAARGRAADDGLTTHLTRLRSRFGDFTDGTSWGHFDITSLLSGFSAFIAANGIDERWVSQIAAAFGQAGREGAVNTLPDAALEASLRSAGLDGTRASITYDDASAWGLPPTTGYADDPVNTASGNFVLPHTDLLFDGVVSGLRLTRVYNSRSDAAGAFGRGWSSWAETRLRARPDGAHFAGPDGQRALFPRSGAGYGQIPGVRGLVSPTREGLALEWFGGERWEFDPSGRPVRTSHGPGTSVEFGYDEQGRLDALVHEGGIAVRLDWSGERVSSVSCSDGRSAQYQYDDAANLVESRSEAGVTRFGLDDAARIVSVSDADGVVVVQNSYDAESRVREQVSNFGRRSFFRYLPGQVTVTGDDGGGPSNTYVHDQAGRLLAVIDGHDQRFSLTYDQWGNPVTATDRGGAVTVQQWDERARLVRRVLPGGAEFTVRYDDADRVLEVSDAAGAATRYRYDGDERSPAEIVDPEGGVTRLTVSGGLVRRVIDPDGVELSFAYDARGSLTAATDADGATARLERDAAGRVIAAVTPLGRRTTFTYDERGLLTQRRDPTGAVWQFGYTAAGRPNAVIDPTGARQELEYGEHGSVASRTDALGQATTSRYDIFGNVVAVVAPDGAKWDLGYDALSRLTSLTDPAGATWLREYDVNGNLTGSIDPAGTHYRASVDRAGRVTGLDDGLTSSTFEFDALGRALAHRRPDGTQARTGYDRCGRRTWFQGPDGGVTRVEYTPGGKVWRVVAPSGSTQTYEYDRCGRLAARVDSEGRRWEHHYDADGALIARTAPGGESENFTFDHGGRLTQSWAPGQGTTVYRYDQTGRITSIADRVSGRRRFRYDRAGRLTEAVDAHGGTTRYAYNERNWLVSVTDPLGGVVTRQYDEVGRLVGETDPLGRTTTLSYDPAGRLIERRAPGGVRLRWSYDPSGRISAYGEAGQDPITVGRDALGRVVRVDEPGSFSHQLRWDAAGRMVERRRGELAVGWSYDTDGRRTAMQHPDGSRTSYRYDGSGLITSLQHPAVGAVGLGRDASGRLTSVTGRGIRRTWTYQDGDLAGYTQERDGQRRETRLERDALGRVVAVSSDGERTQYGYDDAGQLVSARLVPAGPGSAPSETGDWSFGYDAAGRLVQERTPAGPADYTYDAAGQLVTRAAASGTTRYACDEDGRRVSETGPDGECQYQWDPFGRLVGITRPAPDRSSTRLRVDAFGELAEVDGVPLMWDSAGPIGDVCSIGDRTVIGVGGPWAVAGAGAGSEAGAGPGFGAGAGAGSAEWLDRDWQGSASAARDPFGAPAFGDGPAFGYRGEIEFGGVAWLRNRVYDPSTRAFLSPDPLAPMPGTAYSGNSYHYAGNNPIGLSDPLGLRPVTDQQLQYYRDHMSQGLIHDVNEWVHDNWELIAAGAMIAAGVVVMATGVGGPVGAAMIAGGLISAGASTGIQKITTGDVDWGQVAKDGLIGVAAGGAGAVAGLGATAALGTKVVTGSTVLSRISPVAGKVISGMTGGAAGGATARGLSGGDPFDPKGLAIDLLIGGGAAGIGGRLGGKKIPIYRGTDRTLDSMTYQGTGRLMSDAAGVKWLETQSLSQAQKASESAHQTAIQALGDETSYVQAHGSMSHELPDVTGAPRSMMSFTTDIDVAKRFAGPDGTIYTTLIKPGQGIVQSLEGAGESEILIRHMIKVKPWTD